MARCVLAVGPRAFSCGTSWLRCVVAFALGLLTLGARADDSSPELVSPLVCSQKNAWQPELRDICEVTPLGKGHRVKVNLTAGTAEIQVAGYAVVTENYGGKYLSAVIEAMPGDTVAAHLVNLLGPPTANGHPGMSHAAAGDNPTNLHYFHGGIVTPNNARPPIDAGKGNGDNIYVRLKNGRVETEENSFDYDVPIPGEGKLDAGVFEREGFIPHPLGLNWYHSHLHGIASNQVMGGLSGLLSIGENNANVRAKCAQTAPDPVKCNEDNTAVLKDRTDVRYVLLRDISLQEIGALPEDAKGEEAIWAPRQRDFDEINKPCKVFKKTGSGLTPDENPKLRKGFCQRDEKSAWLFTLNGQRFPTITVEGERNVLLRIGNLSANVAYWLELCNENSLELCNESTGRKETPRLTVLSLDGVVPAKPVAPEQAKIPVDAFDVKDLLLMPASRAEIYIRNDERPHSDTQVYILRTKKVDAGTDVWPEIQLARVVLKPNKAASSIAVALNAPIVLPYIGPKAEPRLMITPPEGCVRDLDPSKGEHRRVTFLQTPTCGGAEWCITTEIVHPLRPDPTPNDKFPERAFKTSVGTKIEGLPFEAYEQDGTFDWEGKRHPHVCIRLDHEASHKQLWVLFNNTGSLHNFHIHQMKFRLATGSELEAHHIMPPTQSHTCVTEKCSEPDYKFFDEEEPKPGAGALEPKWHDTIPLPAGSRVFLIMSFGAQEQVGRFVFHCHILKHEDTGLMAPIEVWDPKRGQAIE